MSVRGDFDRGGIKGWLEKQNEEDTDSVVGSEVGVTCSEFGDFDNSRHYLDEEEVLGAAAAVEAGSGEVETCLGHVARSAQRLAVCGMHRMYVRGRMYDHPDYSVPVVVQQKFFRVERYMQMSSLDDSVLYDALASGPVVTRLGAETGMGKTRKLPGMIASKCNLRVLQLEPDNVIAADAMRVQAAEYNIRASAKAWSREKRAYLTVMSYHEFRGIVCSGSRLRLFEDFDVIYMDEAHMPVAAVYAAKQYFASYSRPHNSLIIASATVSTEEGNNSTARKVGTFKQSTQVVSLEDAMDSGVLISEHLKDRVMLLVASDEQVALARVYYEQEGMDVCVLDGGSVAGDVAAVVKRFSVPGSVVPRVLIATEWYGTCYNIPVSHVITTGSVRVYELDAGNELIEKEIPVMRKSVTQHKGRTGRGLVPGSGGWVMRPDAAPDRELMASEALEAYLSLVAADIEPRPGSFGPVADVLPRGINKVVARLLLRCSLPPALTVRYLGVDGRVASRFVQALSLFFQQGEPVLPSRDPYPVGYESWKSEKVGQYFVGDELRSEVEVKVPFSSPPGLRIGMHTLSAVEQGYLEVPRWTMAVDEDVSDDDEVGIRKKVVRVRRAVPRVVKDVVLTPVPEDTVSTTPWAYDVDPNGARTRRKRQAMSWEANGDGKGAATVLLRALRDGDLGASRASVQLDVPEFSGKAVYGLPLVAAEEIAVDSPGGGRILLVSRGVHDKWMSGEALSAKEFVGVFVTLRELKAVKRFAMSTVFDNWSSAWLSWFDSYAVEENMQTVKSAGLHRIAIDLIGYLYDRFRAEVLTVVNSSAMYKDSLQRFFSRSPSLTKFVSAFRKGRVPLAQSDRFISRLLKIKDSHDSALMAIEKVGLFAPHRVTAAQQRLPVRDGHRRMPVIDADVVSRPDNVDGLSEVKGRWRR
jgi:hypothetical protein